MSEENKIVWLSSDLVKAIHDTQLKMFGGPAGIRDEGAVESALGRLMHRWAYEGADLRELAAAYAFGIARNHPFVDGNKRAGWVTMRLFIARNSRAWTHGRDGEDEAVRAVEALAARTITEETFTNWVSHRVSGR